LESDGYYSSWHIGVASIAGGTLYEVAKKKANLPIIAAKNTYIDATFILFLKNGKAPIVVDVITTIMSEHPEIKFV